MTVSKEVLIEKLDQIEVAYKDWRVVTDKVEGIFGGDFLDGEIGRSVDSFINLSVELFSELSGIPTDVMWWWMYDADWGKSTTCTGVCRKEYDPCTYVESNAEFNEWELSSVGA